MKENGQYSQLKEENHDHEEVEYFFNDSDMAAAHQLMQLSDEDDHQNINNNKNIMINKDEDTADDHGEEVDQICSRITTSTSGRRRPDWVKVINEEIFGKDVDEEEVCDIDDQPQLPDFKIMKRRYRSLASIYRETKPIDDDNEDDQHCQDEVLMKKKLKTLMGFSR